MYSVFHVAGLCVTRLLRVHAKFSVFVCALTDFEWNNPVKCLIECGSAYSCLTLLWTQKVFQSLVAGDYTLEEDKMENKLVICY